MSWDQKLERLKEKLGVTAEALAATLGITTRTLADFMKPVADGGREPTGPVQRLIDLLLGEMDSQDLARRPMLNLVIIHSDFQVAGNHDDPVDAILNMHREGGRNNEFHYVTIEPEKKIKWIAEGLTRRKIPPHFFACDARWNTRDASDCYFTATAMWLAAQATRRDLAHITLAADVGRFWPLARELSELAEVEVTMVLDKDSTDADFVSHLGELGVRVADPAGRSIGLIDSLKQDVATGKITYGFINPNRDDLDLRSSSEGSRKLFFSWNHMLKSRDGRSFEDDISQLAAGDTVSYRMGMNNQGPCAIDVALVHRAHSAPPPESKILIDKAARPLKTDAAQLEEIIINAVAVCADKNGWALASDVGNRATVLHPNFKELFKTQPAAQRKVLEFAEARPVVFEVSRDGQAPGYAAACMRLKSEVR